MGAELEPGHAITILSVVTWSDGSVSVRDSAGGTPPLSGADLAERYWIAMRELTLGLVGRRGDAVVVGPFELLRFGAAHVGPHAVEWPIEGGLLADAAGGAWRIASRDGEVEAAMTGFRPRLPRPLYAVSHLQVHLLFTRLFLLRLRAPQAAPPGVRASRRERNRAAAVDVALCVALARTLGRRHRVAATLGVLAGYHVGCWTTSGRTLGGMLTGRRVVSADGRPLTPGQAALRFVAWPLSWFARRPVHDEIAGTDVIAVEK